MSIKEGQRLGELSRAIRQSTIKRLRVVGEGFEDWRPVPGAMSFGDIARHLIECDEWLFHKLAVKELEPIRGTAGAGDGLSFAEFQILIERLEVLGKHKESLLEEMTEGGLSEKIYDSRLGGEVTVWWIIVRGNLDHETHHRGQLAAYLRISGQ